MYLPIYILEITCKYTPFFHITVEKKNYKPRELAVIVEITLKEGQLSPQINVFRRNCTHLPNIHLLNPQMPNRCSKFNIPGNSGVICIC